MQQRHGSGKTAVLVERIIQKIINQNMDIDKILVVTFTNAAASEMRQRILDAIYKKLEENPDNEHLQKQTTLISKANISTIHAFCLEVIKNNFYNTDISPNFSIGDTTQIEILKQEVLEEIFEDKYLQNDEEFVKLINTYTDYRGDENLKDILLKIYKYIQSSPFPNKWLEENIEKFNLSNKLDEDFSSTIWGKMLLEKFKEELESYILEMGKNKIELAKESELDKYYKIVCDDIEMLQEILVNLDNWDKTYELLKNDFKRWPTDKKVTSDKKDIAKESRDNIKEEIKKAKRKIFNCNSRQANEDMYSMYEILKKMQKVLLEFDTQFAKRKKEKNIIDFNDIEHFALRILVKQDEEGNCIPSEVAKQYQDKFVEIAIDEYQDSNLVQEYILSSISNGNNIFMVGDVKQSIYKFRQARPELFIDKYETYKLKENLEENDNLKIQLFKNFRSRKNILDITNTVFENIMNKKLGDIEYNENEFLNLGANYIEPEKEILYAGKTELNIINLKEEEIQEDFENEDDEEEEQVEEERIENIVLEAKFVANKMKELLRSGYKVYDKNVGYRDIQYKDIVVLLRSTAVFAPVYEREISSLNIPVFSDTSSEYLESTEIQTIMALLKIIDNPMQDIPLVTVMRSMIGGFNDNELVEIRLAGEKVKGFYNVVLCAKEKVTKTLKNKIEKLLENLNNWRKEQEYLALDELIWKIYMQTGYYHYVGLMTNGGFRQANLKMLFEKAKQYESANFKGLFNFITFIDKLKNSNNDMSAAKLIGENENVVRIMSIHKSKGLEFPVVFLCGTGKQFNLQDLNDKILLHQDLGIGPKYIDCERRIQYNTLAKEAIKYKTRLETLSEEMRILYVALTRAKEKLIITGLSKNMEELNKKQQLLDTYNGDYISSNIVAKYVSYLDWLELVYLKNKETIESMIDLQVYQKEDVLRVIKKEEQEKSSSIIEEIQKKVEKLNINKELKEKICWKYGNIEAIKIPTKTSVTKIKELKNEAKKDFKLNKENEKRYETEMTIPKFMQEEVKISSARKGSIIHLCIQRMDEKVEYDLSKIDTMIQEMVNKNIILENEAEAIDKKVLLDYAKSGLFREIGQAKEVHKEQPFYIYMSAKEIFGKDIDEKILVQGIIDLYYITKEDEIVLVDFKTDKVKTGEELIKRYKEQLEIYKKAIEISTGKIVDRVCIYSVGQVGTVDLCNAIETMLT